MGWVRISDDFYQHPKVLQAGPQGTALYVAGLCYANKYLTDGFVPAAALAGLTAVDDHQGVAGKLVEVGLWAAVEDGWRIHDYLDYQLSKEAILAEREAARERARDRAAKARGSRHPPRASPEVRPKFARTTDEPQPNSAGTSLEVREKFVNPKPKPNVPTEHNRARARDAPRRAVENPPAGSTIALDRISARGCPACHSGWVPRADGTVEPCPHCQEPPR